MPDSTTTNLVDHTPSARAYRTAAKRDAQDLLTAIATTARAFSTTTTDQADANDGLTTHDRDASSTGPYRIGKTASPPPTPPRPEIPAQP